MSTARLEAMRERLRESEGAYGHGSAYDDLRAICISIDARLTIALIERNEARAKLAAIADLLAKAGCDPACRRDMSGYVDDSERCRGCQVAELLDGAL